MHTEHPFEKVRSDPLLMPTPKQIDDGIETVFSGSTVSRGCLPILFLACAISTLGLSTLVLSDSHFLVRTLSWAWVGLFLLASWVTWRPESPFWMVRLLTGAFGVTCGILIIILFRKPSFEWKEMIPGLLMLAFCTIGGIRAAFVKPTTSALDQEHLAACLAETKQLIDSAEDSYCIDGLSDGEISMDLEMAIEQIESGATPDWEHLKTLFAPSGAIQDIAIDQGWHDRFLYLASELDATVNNGH